MTSIRPPAGEAGTRLITLSRIERFLLREIAAEDLSLLEFALWQDGCLTMQRKVDDLEEEVRLRDIIDSRRAPLDVRPLLGLTFAEISRIRREPALAERAEQASQRRSGDAA